MTSLEDELTSINAIYDSDTLVLVDNSPSSIYTLKLPLDVPIVLRLSFPHDYPISPPTIHGTESIGESAPKGIGTQAVDLARQFLSIRHISGEPAVYGLIEEITPLIDTELQARTLVPEITPPKEELFHPLEEVVDPQPNWTIAPPIQEKNSVFIARCALVSSLSQAQQYISQLLKSDKRVAKATHNITAWRIKSGNEKVQDYDDDGETAAGSRVLKLLQVLDTWNVVVVVSRWYGGIKLGPDRFRIINNVAREALVLAGIVDQGSNKK